LATTEMATATTTPSRPTGAGDPKPPSSAPSQQQEKSSTTTTTTKRKRRQLKMEDFKCDLALPHVYSTFYDSFRDGADCKKGTVREGTAGKLKRLIGLYYRWQHWAFPGFAFRDFAERAQTFGGSYLFKRELDELRKEAINICSRQGLEPAEDGEDVAAAAGAEDGAQDAGAKRRRMDWVEDDEDLELDDEDLLALQKEEPVAVAAGCEAGEEPKDADDDLEGMGDEEQNALLADEPEAEAVVPSPAEEELEDVEGLAELLGDDD